MPGVHWFSLVIAMAMLVAACGQSCNEVGCTDGVEVSAMNAFPVEVLPVLVTTCADAVCNSSQIDREMTAPDQVSFGLAGSVPLDEQTERDVNVTFEVRSLATNEVLVSASGVGRLRRSQPNGEDCPPICFGTHLTYAGTGDQLTGG